MATKKTARQSSRKSAKKAKSGTLYIRIAHHIYSTGVSYRVRAMIGGEKISAYFTNKKKAFKFRTQLLAR